MKTLSLLVLLLTQAASAQLISVGVRGGAPLTDSFANVQTIPPPDYTRQYSGSKEYIVGAMVELHLPSGFSVEADGLYHPLNITQEFSTGTAIFHESTTFNSWEFPILAKYRFLHSPLVKPFVEGGPSFRAAGSFLGNYLSNSGFAMGGGVEIKLGRMRLEPELRYVRWRADATFQQDLTTIHPQPPSNLNQAEFLVGVAF